ncbi:MAG: hypothetical protein QGM50_02860 [Anaerolineae bacterium]|nr:hypothetical protein [Anaerolineae bacterium]
MKKLTSLINKTIVATLVLALTLSALPMSSVSASGLNAPDDPPTDRIGQSDERIEQIWVRLQGVYENLGQKIDRSEGWIEKLQGFIDRLEENGKDVTGLQAALDTFEDALKEAHPIYESAKGIVNSHQGFDADGKVTDHEKAIETVRALADKLKEIRAIVADPGKALREAFQAYRDAHRQSDSGNPQRNPQG